MPAVRPQSFGDGGLGQLGKLTESFHPKLAQLQLPALVEREQRERQRREELARLRVGDDEHLARRATLAAARAAKRRSAAPIRASQPDPTEASARRSASSSPP